jgi:hypothetical protein
MYRKFRSDYPGKCAKCGNAYNRGDLIYWERGNRNVFHALCFGSQTADQQVAARATEIAEVASRQQTELGDIFRINVTELKSVALDVLNGDKSYGEAPRFLKAGTFGGWNEDELRDWLKNGYKTAAFQNLHTESPPIRKRRKLRASEEGELQIDLALSGFDMPFFDWTKRETAPGLRVDIQLDFMAVVRQETITAFQTWCARMLYTLETNGFDMEINVFSTTHRLFSNGKTGTQLINVKREGKASDFQRWSAMFSPAGYRGLVWTAYAIHAKERGWTLSSGLGRSIGHWDVEFDANSRKMVITIEPTSNNFPEQEMDLKVRAFLKKFN